MARHEVHSHQRQEHGKLAGLHHHLLTNDARLSLLPTLR